MNFLIQEGNTLFVLLPGEIDHYQAHRLAEQIDEALVNDDPEALVFDFKFTNFMDSSGIALILGRAECAGAVGASVQVTGLADPIYKLIGLSGIDKISNLMICRTLRSEK